MTLDLVDYFETINYQWNEEEINKRQEKLAEIAYNDVWNIA